MNALPHISIFEALGNETRYRVFVFIYRSGAVGVRPKEIIDEFGVDSGTLDFHLKRLLSANLISLKSGARRGVYCGSENLPLGLTLLLNTKEVQKESVSF
jgi:predicted transcriptional regulator